MLADLCPNVYFDTSSSNDWVKYQDHSLSLREVFRRTLDVVGPKRLLFGTDSSFFPRGWQAPILEAQATALYELGVSEADAHAIFAENFSPRGRSTILSSGDFSLFSKTCVSLSGATGCSDGSAGSVVSIYECGSGVRERMVGGGSAVRACGGGRDA
jgi:hypothetical protein